MRKLWMLLMLGALFALVVPAGAGAVYPYPVSVTVTGPGSVTDATGAINCPGTCGTSYPSGQTTTFTETPQSGQQFGGWSTSAPVVSGCTSTSTTCQVRIDCDACGASVSVAATFDPVENVAITGSGTVTGTGGVNCPSGPCSLTATPGEQIQLTAVPASGYEFSNWTGGQCATQGSPCTFSIDSGQTVTANFAKLLNVKIYIGGVYGDTTGDLGSVTDDSNTINCPSACSGQFATGAVVTLTFHPGLVGGLQDRIEWVAGCASAAGDACIVDPNATADSVTGATVTVEVLPPTPVDVAPPTITGEMTNGDYAGSKRLITNSSLICHPGQWKGDPVFTYDWSYLPAKNGLPSTEDLGAESGGGFPGPVDDLSWDPGGPNASASCAVSAYDAFEGPEPVTPASVTVPVAPPQPVRLTSPQIGLHVSPGGTNTCTPGTYKYLFGSGKFSYRWLLSGSESATTKVVGSKQTMKVVSSWLGKFLRCQVKVTPDTLWKPLTERSTGYVVRSALTALLPPSVVARGQDPTRVAVAQGPLNATVSASVVDMTCSHGGWIGGTGLTYKYAWVSDLGGTVHGDKLHLDMHAGRTQYDMSVRCAVTATASDGRTATELSAAVTVTSGCTEAIQEVATTSDPGIGNVAPLTDWAYYELPAHSGLAFTAPPASIGGPRQVNALDGRTPQNSGYATVDPYPVQSGLFGLKSTGTPSNAPWPFFGYIWQQLGTTSKGASSYTQEGQFTPSHGTANLTGPNCGEYTHFLNAHGYQTRQVPNFSALIP